MDLRHNAEQAFHLSMNILSFPYRTTRKLGGSALGLVGRGSFVENLQADEPFSRAKTALGGARRAIKRKDNDLVLFETMRASGAIKDLAKEDPEGAAILAPEAIDVMMGLPDSELGAKVAEKATAEAFEAVVGTINEDIVDMPEQKQIPAE